MEDQIRSILDEMLKKENAGHIVINPNVNKKATIIVNPTNHILREAIEKKLVEWGYSMENITSLHYDIPDYQPMAMVIKRNLGILNSIARSNIVIFEQIWGTKTIECIKVFMAHAIAEGCNVYQATIRGDFGLLISNYEGEEIHFKGNGEEL